MEPLIRADKRLPEWLEWPGKPGHVFPCQLPLQTSALEDVLVFHLPNTEDKNQSVIQKAKELFIEELL